jgi:hypothetical protein
MTKELVFNYYNSNDFESIIPSLDPSFKVTIYNKSGKNLGRYSNEIICENIGREGHTYLFHIIENYDTLSDITAFMQDDFFNHLFNYEYFINNFNNNINEMFYQFPCSWRIGDGVSTLSRTVKNGYLDLFTMPNNFSIREFSEKFNIHLPEIYQTETCAHFMISKERIHRHPKKLYQDLLEWLLSDERNGYTLEHCWKILFM